MSPSIWDTPFHPFITSIPIVEEDVDILNHTYETLIDPMEQNGQQGLIELELEEERVKELSKRDLFKKFKRAF